MDSLITDIGDRILSGGSISFDEAIELQKQSGADILTLMALANRIRERFCGSKVDLCAIINAKSGRCPEDCSFCAQSSYYSTGCPEYPLLEQDRLIGAAENAKRMGAANFCIVTSGNKLDDKEFRAVCITISRIRNEVGIDVDGSLGFVSGQRAHQLKEAGIVRYNHNLETSEDFYHNICSTHRFEDRVRSVEALKAADISTCCGGIIGVGEEPLHRIKLAFKLKELDIDCVPINILNPRPGTPLGSNGRLKPIEPMEILKTIAIFRFVLPKAIIKLAGGRQVNLRDLQAAALLAGANGLIIGNYLTTPGGDPERDLQMIKDLGFEY